MEAGEVDEEGLADEQVAGDDADGGVDLLIDPRVGAVPEAAVEAVGAVVAADEELVGAEDVGLGGVRAEGALDAAFALRQGNDSLARSRPRTGRIHFGAFG